MKLVYIMLCIPLNTACCERGFSIHSAIKTKIRSRTSIAILDTLIRIKCVFPTEMADPASGTPAEARRNLFMSAVTDGYQQRCESIGARLYVVTAGLQAPVEDADRGSEDGGSEGYGSECSIAVSLDALEGYEEGLRGEEEEEACVSSRLLA
jgi:hypothetical protein